MGKGNTSYVRKATQSAGAKRKKDRQREKRQERRRKAAAEAAAEASRFAEKQRQMSEANNNPVAQEEDQASKDQSSTKGAYNPVRESETSYFDATMQDRAKGKDEQTVKDNAMSTAKSITNEVTEAASTKASGGTPNYSYTTSMEDKGYDGATASDREKTLIQTNIDKIQAGESDITNDEDFTVYNYDANTDTISVKDEFANDGDDTTTTTVAPTGNTGGGSPSPSSSPEPETMAGTAGAGEYGMEDPSEALSTALRKRRRGKKKLRIAKNTGANVTGSGTGLNIPVG
tara:strand:+ start:3134 stop:3997 length:864 start_codon:yes stop_codon:yes gene_type:complete